MNDLKDIIQGAEGVLANWRSEFNQVAAQRADEQDQAIVAALDQEMTRRIGAIKAMERAIAYLKGIIPLVVIMLMVAGCGRYPSAEEQKAKAHAAEVKGKVASSYIDRETRALDHASRPQAKKSPSADPSVPSGQASGPAPQAHTTATPDPSADPQPVVRPAPPADPSVAAAQNDCQEVKTAPTGVVYQSTVATWADAAKNAPAGKRMATCGETVTLYKTGALAKIPGAMELWTSTPKSDPAGPAAYLVNNHTGAVNWGDVGGESETIYVNQ